DGKRIAFDARPAGRAQVYVVDAEGGTPQPLTTTDAGDAIMPAWSPDGTLIYYTLLDGKGGSDIWKVAAAGGSAERVTRIDGFSGFPSTDGATLYVGNRSMSGISSLPVGGGTAAWIPA